MPTPQYCCGVGRWQIGSMANSLSLRVNAHCVMLESKALANFSHFDPHCCFFTSAAFASHIPMFHWFKYVQVQVQQIATILRISFVFVCSSKHPCIIYYDHLYIYIPIYIDTYSYIYIYDYFRIILFKKTVITFLSFRGLLYPHGRGHPKRLGGWAVWKRENRVSLGYHHWHLGFSINGGTPIAGWFISWKSHLKNGWGSPIKK